MKTTKKHLISALEGQIYRLESTDATVEEIGNTLIILAESCGVLKLKEEHYVKVID